MKKNKLIVIVSLILIIIASILVLTGNKDTFTDKTKKFDISDTAVVTRVFLTDKKNNSVLLVKKGTEWSLNKKYKARKEAVRDFLITIKDLRVKFPVPKTAHNTVIKHLASSGTKVEIYQQAYRINIFGKIKFFPYEKLSKVYFVGSATQDNMGNYMLSEGADIPYVVYIPGFRGFLTPYYSTVEDDWRDHTVFDSKITEISDVKVEFPGAPDESFQIFIDQEGNFSLKGLSKNQFVNSFDTIQVISFLTSFEKVNYETMLTQILSKGKKDTIHHTQPFAIITLKDKTNNESQAVLIRKIAYPGQTDLYGNPVEYDRDRLYAVLNNGKDIALIQYFAFGAIIRPLGSFQKK